MNFVDAMVVLRRHKLLAVYGLLVACLLATISAYRLDGIGLVSRADPQYQSTAVVAVRPGAEQPTATTAPPTTDPAPPAPSEGENTGTSPGTVGAPTTTAASPPLAPLSAVIDSRAMYYTALSLKTIVVSPGFAEAVKARAPSMDGTVTAVVAQDTNTMDLVVDGSTPAIAARTMAAALAELKSVVVAYSATPATRFGLEGELISAPSTPTVTSSIKEPLTFVIVLAVVIVLWWFLIRLVDVLEQARRHSRTAPAPRDLAPPRAADAAAQSGNGHRSTPTAPVP